MALYIKLTCKNKNDEDEICGLKINGVETNKTTDEDAFEAAKYYLPSSINFKKAEYITAQEWISCGYLILPDGNVIRENICDFTEEVLKTSYNRGKLLEIP